MTISTPFLPGSWEETQGWGPTDFSFEPAGHGYAHWHTGIDISGADIFGTPIVAPLAGTVEDVVNQGGFGYEAIFFPDADPNERIILGHLSRFGGSGHVGAGSVLGYVGSTGNSTGAHLHLEEDVRQGSGWTDVNPSNLLGGSAMLTGGAPGTPGASTTTSGATYVLADQGQGILGTGIGPDWGPDIPVIPGKIVGRGVGVAAGSVVTGVFTGASEVVKGSITPWFLHNAVPLVVGALIWLLIVGGPQKVVQSVGSDVKKAGGVASKAAVAARTGAVLA